CARDHGPAAQDLVAGNANVIARGFPGEGDLRRGGGAGAQSLGLAGRRGVGGGVGVGPVQRDLLTVGADRAEGIAGAGAEGIGVVVARPGCVVLAEADDAAGRTRLHADPVVARREVHRGSEGEVIPAGGVWAAEGELFG